MRTAEAVHPDGVSALRGRLRIRHFWMGLGAASMLLISATAWAGSYLNRASLLMLEAAHEAKYVRARLGDRELARMVHTVAEARVGAAGRMEVPKEVALAHPHLLLAMENYERAMASAEAGEAARFLVYVRQAQDEEAILRSVLKRLGWPLPEG